MKLLVGLGNPGKKYEKTRHNTGFMTVDAIASALQSADWRIQTDFNAEISESIIGDEKIILAKPQTFMNESGKAVKAIAEYYGAPRIRAKHIPLLFGGAESAEAEKKPHSLKNLQTRVSAKADKIDIKDIIVIHDDLDIPLGEYKIVRDRSSAGHKGVQSIIDALGTKDFTRIRIGTLPQSGKPENTEKFVLEKFTKEEEKIIAEVIEKVCKEIEILIKK